MKHAAEAVEQAIVGRGAFRRGRRCAARRAGRGGKADVGISNENAGGKPAHRKTKVSWPTIIGSG